MSNKPVIKFKKLQEGVRLPEYGTDFSAGMDIYSGTDEITIGPGAFVKVHTGIAGQIPEGYFGAVYPRSGLATKQGLVMKNTVGIIDSDYRGEWLVCLHNTSDDIQIIESNTRIAQVIIQPHLSCTPVFVDELTDTDRGAGGFGSTGVK